jgi:small multidrug resistance family-3 protein
MEAQMMAFAKTASLLCSAEVAEIGCYLPYLWLKQGKLAWLLIPAALSLALFVWLIAVHPFTAGRRYGAYAEFMWLLPSGGFGGSST